MSFCHCRWGWGDSCYSELFLLVLLGWKHSPMMGDYWCRRPDVGQLMSNGFQVSSPIMRITAKTAANKTPRPARQLNEESTQSYLHLGSAHVCSVYSAVLGLLSSAFNAFNNLYKKYISLSFNSRTDELCKRGKFMRVQNKFLPPHANAMRLSNWCEYIWLYSS